MLKVNEHVDSISLFFIGFGRMIQVLALNNGLTSYNNPKFSIVIIECYVPSIVPIFLMLAF